MNKNISLNASCPCGSGKKYKRCCLSKKDAEGQRHNLSIPPLAGFAVDWILWPALIVLIAFEPNFMHGLINYNELGQYLPVISGIMRGEALYRDFFVQYGPLQFYLPATAFLIFGKTLVVMKGFFHFSEIIGFLTFYVLSRRVLKNRFLVYSVSLLAVIQAHHPYWSSNWGGLRFALIYAHLLFLVLFLEDKRIRNSFAAGIFSLLAFLTTFDAGAICFASMALFFATLAFCGQKETVRKGLPMYLAGAGLITVLAAVFLAVTGSLAAFLSQLASLSPGRAFVQPLRKEELVFRILYPAIVYFISAFAILRNSAERRAVGVAIGVSGMLSYVFSLRAIHGPQFDTALPLAVLSSFITAKVIFDSKKSYLILAGVVLVVIHACLPNQFFSNIGDWASYQFRKEKLVAAYRTTEPIEETVELNVPGGGQTRVPLKQVKEIEGTTNFILQNTNSKEALLGFPDLAIFNFFADRPQATRFTINALALPKNEWRKELLESVIEKKPETALISSKLSTIAQALGLNEEVLPEVRSYLYEHYTSQGTFGSITVLRRKK